MNHPIWTRFSQYLFTAPAEGFALDISRIQFPDSLFDSMQAKLAESFASMKALESGAISNPDEKRMVGHYWLRTPELAPNAEIRTAVEQNVTRMQKFAAEIHSGTIRSAANEPFKHLLVIGIGGSALGPQFVSQALSTARDPMDLYFFDNTDPDGMDKVLGRIPDLRRTLCVVISKSGGTKETRNGQLIAKAALQSKGIAFNGSFVAITMDGSELDTTAKNEGWLARFPMWDWVGGRTSELSAVGLLPAALQGFDIAGMLAGARAMDALTRIPDTRKNPAALIALMWHHVGGGRGQKDMVVLPYKDRIELLSRYLQQLVMESLGKERDLSGAVVNQGIAVYGNKGSTDQHAYVQQLRDGLNNFFAVFIEVLKDSALAGKDSAFGSTKFEVEPGVTAGDYLQGFYLGTRAALFENKRESISITIDEVNAKSVGMLIALFERAVGLYATLINVNAYHQPGVEAGKKAAARVLDVQKKAVEFLKKNPGEHSAESIATAIQMAEDTETIFKVLWRLSANGKVKRSSGESFAQSRFAA